jgi:acetoin utilization deacetylase AcuC-like enzyme
MHTFYHPGHTKHDPGDASPPVLSGEDAWFTDSPARAETLHKAIRAADFGPVITPGDFGIEPIWEVHDHSLISLLQNAHRLLQEEDDTLPLIPDTFSARHHPSHKPRSLAGLLGYYCFDTFTPILESTWKAAYWSAQTAISGAALVLAGSDQLAYALCRPPGHHAAHQFYGGHCYLNNAAIAANWLVQQGQRVAIVDIDYHHGNGTQSIFYNRSDILFCSIHADPFNEYPYFWGYADEFGQEAGRNYNFNFPLPRFSKPERYLRAVDEALQKVVLFVPDVLVISLGLDIANADPGGTFHLTPGDLATVGRRFHALNLPTLVVQEGGHQIDVLGEQTIDFFNGLLGNT